MKVLVTEKLSEHKYKTPEGYLICVDAVLARTGKQSYMRSELFDTDDETEVDVDRRPEEVFSPQTLASFENKPITKNHPDEDVNSENIKEYSVGFVRDVHKGYDNGQPVILGTLVIQDEETIKEIENGEYTQLSCGYNCDVIDEENPQQKCIRGNHIALCEQGRAGNARIVDSKKVKDEKIYKIIVENAEDRDVSKFITEAQNLGFTTDDKGFVIYLKNGDDNMLKQLKSKTYSNSIKFNDVDMYMIIDKDEAKYIYNLDLSNARYFVTNDAKRADKFTLDNAKRVIDKLKKYVSSDFTMSEYLGDSIKDELYTLEELRKMRIGNYKEIDIYRINGKFSTNPNTSKERFNTFEEVKKYIDNGFRDSIKDVEPKADENKDEFISRFMRETKEEYPDEKQRLAVAYSYWDKKSTKDEESTYTEVTKELEKDYNNFTKDSKLTLDQIINIYKALKKNNR